MARTYRCRPSQLIDIGDPYAAYCFDEACYAWGAHVETELAKASSGAKNEKEAAAKRSRQYQLLMTDLPEPDEDKSDKPKSKPKPKPKQFKDPADLFKGAGKKKIVGR